MGGFIDISGNRYGMLTAIERIETSKDGQSLWNCLCDCGKYHLVKSGNLKRGRVKSCGCMSGKWQGDAVLKHGMTKSRVYHIYYGMKDRCYNPNNKRYKDYGGRGITICKEWLDDFMNFYEWAMDNGYDDNLTIDRVDNNKGYSPNNCRLASKTTQANNRRSNVFNEFNGERHTLSEWERITGIKRATLWARINIQNWNIGKALGME